MGRGGRGGSRNFRDFLGYRPRFVFTRQLPRPGCNKSCWKPWAAVSPSNIARYYGLYPFEGSIPRDQRSARRASNSSALNVPGIFHRVLKGIPRGYSFWRPMAGRQEVTRIDKAPNGPGVFTDDPKLGACMMAPLLAGLWYYRGTWQIRE